MSAGTHRRERDRRATLFGAAFSASAHVAVLLALLAAWRYQPRPPEPEPMEVALFNGPQATPSPTPPAAPKAAPEKPPPPKALVRPTPVPPDLEPLEADKVPAVAELGESDLAGAGTAETGAPGGGCNMTRTLQAALRKDALVQSAVVDAHRAAGAGSGKAILVWNGDWVRNVSQDGKGLAAVREAILWEVGFAPAACRTQVVHGLVVISLGDSPGVPKLAIGGGDWRWADLLALHHATAEE